MKTTTKTLIAAAALSLTSLFTLGAQANFEWADGQNFEWADANFEWAGANFEWAGANFEWAGGATGLADLGDA